MEKNSKYTLSELMEMREAALYVEGYYDNLRQANIGLYDTFSQNIAENARVKGEKYKEVVNKIEREIERRVDSFELD